MKCRKKCAHVRRGADVTCTDVDDAALISSSRNAAATVADATRQNQLWRRPVCVIKSFRCTIHTGRFILSSFILWGMEVWPFSASITPVPKKHGETKACVGPIVPIWSVKPVPQQLWAAARCSTSLRHCGNGCFTAGLTSDAVLLYFAMSCGPGTDVSILKPELFWA